MDKEFKKLQDENKQLARELLEERRAKVRAQLEAVHQAANAAEWTIHAMKEKHGALKAQEEALTAQLSEGAEKPPSPRLVESSAAD